MKPLLITATLCATCLPVFAGQSVNETIDAAKDGYVEIEHVNGSAIIRGWDKNEVQVRGELSDRTDEFIFERDGNEIIIKVEVERSRNGWNWNSDDGDDLEIFVPMGSRVNYNSTNADVDVANVYGGLDVDVVNGDVEVESIKGRIRLETVNGDIDAKELNGSLKMETVNGDMSDRGSEGDSITYTSVNGNIEVVSSAPEIKAETVNGDIELTLQEITDVSLDTVNGSVDASMSLAKNGDVRASSVGGSVTLNFQRGVSARFDIQGHAGGKIINRLSDHSVKKAKYGPSRWLEFSLNGGDANVEVSTVSGRVKLDYQ